MRLMDRYPIIIWIGGGLLGWVGAEMMISDTLSANVLSFITFGLGSFAHLIVKITGFLTVITLAYGVKKYRSSQKREITP